VTPPLADRGPSSAAPHARRAKPRVPPCADLTHKS
jgi:hypothetical protein